MPEPHSAHVAARNTNGQLPGSTHSPPKGGKKGGRKSKTGRQDSGSTAARRQRVGEAAINSSEQH